MNNSANFIKPGHFGQFAELVLNHPKGGVGALISLSGGQESEWLEFKAGIGPPRGQPMGKDEKGKDYNRYDYHWHVARAVIAMANTRGGVILLGISEHKPPEPPEPVGLSSSDPKGILNEKGKDSFFNDVLNHAIHPDTKLWKTGASGTLSIYRGSLIETFKPEMYEWQGKQIAALFVCPVPGSDDLISVFKKETTAEIFLVREKGNRGYNRPLINNSDINDFKRKRESEKAEYVILWERFLQNVHSDVDFIFPGPKSLPQKAVTKIQSEQRFNTVLNEIYPNRYSKINEEIFTGIRIDTEEDESQTIDSDSSNDNLYKIIEQLWDIPGSCHCILVGEGGMGKTTHLLKLWEDFISDDENSPTPLYIRLDDYNRIEPDDAKGLRNFVWNRIISDYLNCVPNDQLINNLKNQFFKKIYFNGKNCPSIILILDGYNEVIIDNSALIKCLNEIRELWGVQIVISSRYDMRNYHNWTEFSKLTLDLLKIEQITHFISSHGMEAHEEIINNRTLLGNPMMLTLYCGVDKEIKERKTNKDYSFFPDPQYKAEIIHNFIEANLSRFNRSKAATQTDQVLNRLYLKHLLPRIGYEIAKKGLSYMERSEVKSIITDELRMYCSDSFLDRNSWFDKHFSKFQNRLTIEEPVNITKILNVFTDNYFLLREYSEGTFEFVHHDFRDYFAAEYIKEQIRIGGIYFKDLSKRVFEANLRGMLGELTHEPRRRPTIKEGYVKGKVTKTILDDALISLRGVEIKNDDYRLFNIVETLKDTRLDLSDTDFSGLDLRHIVFNNVRLGHGSLNCQIQGADLSRCKLSPSTFFPRWHSGHPLCVCYSPDGSKFVSGGEDGKIKIWDTFTGECLMTYEAFGGYPITLVAYSPDGSHIVSAGDDETIRVWDVTDLEQAEDLECLAVYEEHSGGINAVIFSPDGKSIISGGEDGTIQLWDMATAKNIRTYYGHFGAVTSIRSRRDGKRIVSGSEDKTIRLWDIEQETCIKLIDEDSAVTSVDYSPNGKEIVSGNKSGIIKVWNVEERTPEKTIKDHQGFNVRCCYVSALDSLNGGKVLSWTDNRDGNFHEIREWDAESGKCLKKYRGHTNGIASISYNSITARIVSGSYDNTIRQWNVVSGESVHMLKAYNAAINSVCSSLDGKYIFSGDMYGSIKKWHVKNLKCEKIFTGNLGSIISINISADGGKIFSTGSESGFLVWDINTGECLKSNKLVGEKCIAYSPGGTQLFSASNNDEIKQWDVSSGNKVFAYKGFSHPVSAIAYNQDKKKLIGGAGNIIKEWDINIDECCQTYELAEYRLSKEAVSFMIDNKIIPVKPESLHFLLRNCLESLINEKFSKEALTSKLIELGLVQEQIEQVFQFVEKDDTYNITSVCFSPSGEKILAVSDKKTVDQFDILTGKHLFTIKSIYPINAVSYSHDGKYILIANYNLIDKWDSITGQKKLTFEEHTGDVLSVCCRPFWKEIVTGSKDNTIRIWDEESGECLIKIEDVFGVFIQGAKLPLSDSESTFSTDEIDKLKRFGAIIC